MNELGGVGEKDLHQCEEEFLPQKSIEAGSFILFFLFTLVPLANVLLRTQLLFPNSTTVKALIKEGELCECRLYASIRRSIS